MGVVGEGGVKPLNSLLLLNSMFFFKSDLPQTSRVFELDKCGHFLAQAPEERPEDRGQKGKEKQERGQPQGQQRVTVHRLEGVKGPGHGARRAQARPYLLAEGAGVSGPFRNSGQPWPVCGEERLAQT